MRNLESSLYQLQLSRIWAGQEAEKDLKVQCENLKHRHFDFNPLPALTYQTVLDLNAACRSKRTEAYRLFSS